MARPNKSGLDYFNIDTDRYQDQKIKRLKNNFGAVGLAVYDYLLCEIYRDKGCYMPWNEGVAFDVTDYFRIKETAVNEIVMYCGAVGLFDKAVLTRGTLTSKAIQKRYLFICKNANRKDSEKLIPPHINLLLTQEMELITQETTQRKGKKKKENESKEEENKTHTLLKTQIRESVFLLPHEIKQLEKQFNPHDCNWMYDKLNDYKIAKGISYNSDYGAICSWVKKRLKEEKEKPAEKACKIEGALRAGEAALNYFDNE